MGQVQGHSHRRAVVIGGQRIPRDSHSGSHSAASDGQLGCAWILVEVGAKLGLHCSKKEQAKQEEAQREPKGSHSM